MNKNLFHNPLEVLSQVCSRKLPVTDFQLRFPESMDILMLNNFFTIGFRVKNIIDFALEMSVNLVIKVAIKFILVMNHRYKTSYKNQSKYSTLNFISRSHLFQKLKNIAKSFTKSSLER
jgi:hypothetical protein